MHGFAAHALSRLKLDGALRGAARAAGVPLITGVTIQGARPQGEGWTIEGVPGLRARRVVLATGRHALRGRRSSARSGSSCIWRGSPPGADRTGDQLPVIPSFVGDGMAVALASGEAAAWVRRTARQMRVAPGLFLRVVGNSSAARLTRLRA